MLDKDQLHSEFEERYIKWADGDWYTHMGDIQSFYDIKIQEIKKGERERIVAILNTVLSGEGLVYEPQKLQELIKRIDNEDVWN